MLGYTTGIDWLWNIEPLNVLKEDTLKQVLEKINWDGREKYDRETN